MTAEGHEGQRKSVSRAEMRVARDISPERLIARSMKGRPVRLVAARQLRGRFSQEASEITVYFDCLFFRRNVFGGVWSCGFFMAGH